MQAFIGLARVVKDDCNEISNGSLRYFVFPAAAERFSATASADLLHRSTRLGENLLDRDIKRGARRFPRLWERFAWVASRWLAAIRQLLGLPSQFCLDGGLCRLSNGLGVFGEGGNVGLCGSAPLGGGVTDCLVQFLCLTIADDRSRL